MPHDIIELRSDTATRPSPAMRRAIAEAPVGDDVLGEDPTVNRLQERIAEMLGMEAAIYVPSGTMSNLIGVRLHCSAGDEMICEAECHIYFYEQAGYAQLSGVSARTVPGDCGVLQVEQLDGTEASLSIQKRNPGIVNKRPETVDLDIAVVVQLLSPLRAVASRKTS